MICVCLLAMFCDVDSSRARPGQCQIGMVIFPLGKSSEEDSKRIEYEASFRRRWEGIRQSNLVDYSFG